MRTAATSRLRFGGSVRGDTILRGLVQPAITHVVDASHRLLLRGRKRFFGGSVSEQLPFLLRRRPGGLRSLTGLTSGASADDRELVERIMAAYRLATSSFAWDNTSIWLDFFEQHTRESTRR